jgi:putative selenate reductase
VDLCRRLTAFAAARGRRAGFKFSNTLEVENHRAFFPAGNPIIYLSGQPLYVIALTLTDEFRRAVGPDVPISFSAGIDQHNFPTAVACGLVPVTACTDLLRPGGYGRLSAYLAALGKDMQRVGARSVDEFILRRVAGGAAESHGDVGRAALANTALAAREARDDPRYRAERNRAVPKRINSQLATFDCITCEKCLPVCPNAANFLYPTPVIDITTHDLIVAPDGSWRAGPPRRFAIERPLQIACYSDFCNECGNCDTFCPEYGGPYIRKPTFFGALDTWERAAPRDGFFIDRPEGRVRIRGRVQGAVYVLEHEPADTLRYSTAFVAAVFSDPLREPHRVEVLQGTATEQTLDLWMFHTLRHLLAGVLDFGRTNQINASFQKPTPAE